METPKRKKDKHSKQIMYSQPPPQNMQMQLNRHHTKPEPINSYQKVQLAVPLKENTYDFNYMSFDSQNGGKSQSERFPLHQENQQ